MIVAAAASCKFLRHHGVIMDSAVEWQQMLTRPETTGSAQLLHKLDTDLAIHSELAIHSDLAIHNEAAPETA